MCDVIARELLLKKKLQPGSLAAAGVQLHRGECTGVCPAPSSTAFQPWLARHPLPLHHTLLNNLDARCKQETMCQQRKQKSCAA